MNLDGSDNPRAGEVAHFMAFFTGMVVMAGISVVAIFVTGNHTDKLLMDIFAWVGVFLVVGVAIQVVYARRAESETGGFVFDNVEDGDRDD